MNKKQVIYQLKQVLNKVKDNRYNSLKNYFTSDFTEAERDALQYAIDFLSNEHNDANNINKIKEEYKETLKEEIQEHCDHTWGEDHWTWSCGGYHKCTKCGKIEEFYERD